MENRRDLLVEIGTEELPPKALLQLSESFADNFRIQLEKHRLSFRQIEKFATPRRLALLVRDLETAQPDQEVIRKGPALRASYDKHGQPTKALLGFARSCGVEFGELEQEESPKGIWLTFRQAQSGKATRDLVSTMVEHALAALPIPKPMRWGDGEDEFVRPVHWIVVLYGNETLPGNLFGIDLGHETRGHRFHHPQPITLSSASEYEGVLRRKGHVEPRFSIRRDMIRKQVEALALEESAEAIIEDDLLDEVTALCEWPTAILGSFEEDFLEVPPEVLIETMQKNQKYFALRSQDGRRLLPKFIAISNINSREPSQVRAGNERVIRPRFADAAFFWQQDLKHALETFAPRLDLVVFQKKLGTVGEKSSRVSQICRHLAGQLNIDEALAARSAFLAKCDLVTQMIFEFGSLQGIIGRYYAERSGEDACVCAAMEEQYLPRHAGDRLPRSDCGRVLSIADKLDTLVGIFAIGQRPTGVKDPYALRRAAIGLLRILIETPLALDLKELLRFTAEELRDKIEARQAAIDVFDYCMVRLKGYYQDKGIGSDVVDAVLASGTTIPSDLHRRILAVQHFLGLPEAKALTAANKRIRNILRKSGETDFGVLSPSVLKDDAEKQLAARIAELQSEVQRLVSLGDYEGALKALAGLRSDVDAFFDKVMVMVDDPQLRRNRLALLQSMEALFLRVADISRLQ